MLAAPPCPVDVARDNRVEVAHIGQASLWIGRGLLPDALHVDIVLVDAPPLLPVSDALPLLGVVDCVVLIARAGVTTDSAARRVVRTLERISDVNVLGVVVNDIEDELADYGYAYRPELRRSKGAHASEPQDPAAPRA